MPHHCIPVLSLVLALAIPALAQQPTASSTSIAPRTTATTLAKPIRLSAGNTAVQVPAPTRPLQLQAPQPGASERRKLETLREWRLRVPATALKPGFLLTPAQPILANGAQLKVARSDSYIDYTPSEGMPYGSIPMSRSASVILADLPVSPRDWLLVECHAIGTGNLIAMTGYVQSPSQGAQAARQQSLPPTSGPLLHILLEPSTTMGKRQIQLIYDSVRGTGYTFGGCEITPVNP